MKQLLIKGNVLEMDFNGVMKKFRPLCNKFSNKMFLDGYEKEDLLQVCYMCLYNAYNMYDIEKQNDFFTFCYACINNEFKRLIRDSKNQKRNTDNYSFININDKTNNNTITYSEIIPDKTNIEEEVINSELVKLINSYITEEERLILPILMGLKTQKQYSLEVGISPEGARKRCNKLQLKLKQKLSYNA